MNEHAPSTSNSSENTGAVRPVRAKNLLGIGLGALALGLLIWAKLQLVAGVPRTAVATPEDDQRHGAVTTPAKSSPSSLTPEKTRAGAKRDH